MSTSAVTGDRRTAYTPDDDSPVFVISVAAQLAGMHAQTLRQYDRLGLVSPSRTRGGGRRYSAADVALLREVQRLSQDEGVSLAGIQRILELERQVAVLRTQIHQLTDTLEATRMAAGHGHRVFAAGPRGDIVAMRPGERPTRASGLRGGQALVVWRPR